MQREGEGENIVNMVMICQGLPWLFHASGIIVSYRAVISCFTFSKGCKPELEPEDQEAQSKQLTQ